MAERIIIIFGEKSFEFLVFLLKFSWNLSTIKNIYKSFWMSFYEKQFYENSEFTIHISWFYTTQPLWAKIVNWEILYNQPYSSSCFLWTLLITSLI